MMGELEADIVLACRDALRYLFMIVCFACVQAGEYPQG